MNKNQSEYIYGIHAIKALLQINPAKITTIYLARQKSEPNLRTILQIAHEHKISVISSSQRDLDVLLSDTNHQGIIAQAKSAGVYDESELEILLDNLEDSPFLLILDSVQDPHNLGACLRTANAAGVHAVIVPKDKAVGITPAVRKVACGAAETTPFFAVTNLARTLDMLKKRGIWLFGADAEAKKTIYQVDLCGSLGIVLGAEGFGLRRLTREKCDFLISIPLRGTVTSLNVSVAAGICLFEAVRRKIDN